ncbi:MAG: hypothetical protein BWX89_00702 [candidate division TA06 bacterium ADurb.Bin131]|jgi:phage FluMu protein Com|uniref:Uncharacterized protein n=1 Tax=candidate division TA06 bacterium ADurb.Bin131 TaxID=1852827 RepID=A0A1V6CAT5_UNCT6|nr:MAG: hypothetical protein BWX89_00702 [candidate division TA06 bacterium ADurb.Bin131]
MNAGMEKIMRNDDFYRCPRCGSLYFKCFTCGQIYCECDGNKDMCPECDPVDTTYADFEDLVDLYNSTVFDDSDDE